MPRLLNRAIDWGLIGVIFVAPLFMGGRHPVGQLVFVSMICLTVVAWLAWRCFSPDKSWRWSGAEALLLAATLLVGLQIVPLPPSVISLLSPGVAELLPAWTAESGIGMHLDNWKYLSLTPGASQGGLVMLLAYSALFLVVVQRLDRLADIELLLRWIAIAVAGMAILGISQLLFGNGKFLWVYSHPFRDTFREVKGSFSNGNHFAGFLALGVGPLIWWLQNVRRQREERLDDRSTRNRRAGKSRSRSTPTFGSPDSADRAGRSRSIQLGFAIAIVLLAGLLTFSRGGVIVIFSSAIVCSLIYARFGLWNRSSAAVAGVAGVVVCAALFVYGYEPLMQELETLGSGSVDTLDQKFSRRKLWAADLEAVRDFPLLGTGAGSHSEVYPIYFADYTDVEYTHAESGYVQVLLESGLAGFTVLLLGIGTSGYWCVTALRRSRSSRAKACGAAVTAGLFVSVVQSVWDFVWYIPACMCLTVLLLACACRLYQMSTPTDSVFHVISRLHPANRTTTFGKNTWYVATLAGVGLSIMMISERLSPALAAPHWESYLHRVVAIRDLEDFDRQAVLDAMIGDLEQVVEKHPRHARTHSRLGFLYIRQFDERQNAAENPFPLAQIRRAALASRFKSREAQESWLRVAIGENRSILTDAAQHVRTGLWQCPLQGQSYVNLSELAFLDGRREAFVGACIEQALRVRPHSGAVLYAAGQEALAANDAERAIEYWKDTFARDPDYRKQILVQLAPHLPASFFVTEFNLDLNGMRHLYFHYRESGRAEEAREIGARYAKLLEDDAATETGRPSSRAWYEAHCAHRFVGDADAALTCLSKAVARDPDDFGLRRQLAIQLLVHGQDEEASEQMRWCLRRKPDDVQLVKLLSRTKRKRLATQGDGSANDALHR